jgi:hypothetical protein
MKGEILKTFINRPFILSMAVFLFVVSACAVAVRGDVVPQVFTGGTSSPTVTAVAWERDAAGTWVGTITYRGTQGRRVRAVAFTDEGRPVNDDVRVDRPEAGKLVITTSPGVAKIQISYE